MERLHRRERRRPASSLEATSSRTGVSFGLNITYNLSWLPRQEENQCLAVPLDVARTLPVELLRLMGSARGAYALGYVDHLRDPIEVVRPDLRNDGLGDFNASLERSRAQLSVSGRDVLPATTIFP